MNFNTFGDGGQERSDQHASVSMRQTLDCLRVITHCIVRSVFPADRKGRLMGPRDSQGIEINKESHGAFVVMETSICT